MPKSFSNDAEGSKRVRKTLTDRIVKDEKASPEYLAYERAMIAEAQWRAKYSSECPTGSNFAAEKVWMDKNALNRQAINDAEKALSERLLKEYGDLDGFYNGVISVMAAFKKEANLAVQAQDIRIK